ncbi:MAG: ATP synthase subunit I [Cellvibrionaceae bacterium]
MASIKRPAVFRVTLIQCAVLLLAGVGLSFWKWSIAVAVVIGGVIAIIPHLYFTVFAFRFMGARASQDIARSFYRGETGKFVLTLVGFACVFTGRPDIDPLGLFGGYLTMIVLQIGLVGRAVAHR